MEVRPRGDRRLRLSAHPRRKTPFLSPTSAKVGQQVFGGGTDAVPTRPGKRSTRRARSPGSKQVVRLVPELCRGSSAPECSGEVSAEKADERGSPRGGWEEGRSQELTASTEIMDARARARAPQLSEYRYSESGGKKMSDVPKKLLRFLLHKNTLH